MTANGIGEYFWLVCLFLITAKMPRQVQNVKKKKTPLFLLEAESSIRSEAGVEQMGWDSDEVYNTRLALASRPAESSILGKAHISLGSTERQ